MSGIIGSINTRGSGLINAGSAADGQVLTGTGVGLPTGFEALAASGLTSKVSSFTRNTALSDGNVAYTGVGFQPTAIICHAADYTAVGKASWGFGDSSKTGKSINDYSPVSANTWNPMGDLLAILEAHPKKTRVTIVSYDADGFTLSFYTGGSGPSGTFTCNFICFK
mgnify:FL=1|tara:strand:+ start:628 stop:1128 length:501 start_codon:yes stop_codon:yes gene_type:complete